MLIYLAAADVNWKRIKSYTDDVAASNMGMLMSAAYLTSKADPLAFACSNLNKPKLVLDSGAFSVFTSPLTVTAESISKLLDNYVALARRSAGAWQWIAELDVDSVAPRQTVELAYERLLGIGIPVLRVWHQNRGMDEWRRYCKEYSDVGIGSNIHGNRHEEDQLLRKMVLYAYEQGCRVHGFGRTNLGRLQAVPFYSADSSSWTAPSRWARMVTMTDKGFVQQRRLKDANDLPVGTKAVYVKHSTSRGQMNAMQEALMPRVLESMARLQDYITEYWRKQGVNYGD